MCNEERGEKERCIGIVLLREMVQRVTSHGSEATSHDRVKEAMRRLKLFRRADLEVMTCACLSVCVPVMSLSLCGSVCVCASLTHRDIRTHSIGFRLRFLGVCVFTRLHLGAYGGQSF